MSPRKDDPLLTPDEAAVLLRTTVGTLRVWRWRETGPSYVKRGRSVLYRLSEVNRWVDDRAVAS